MDFDEYFKNYFELIDSKLKTRILLQLYFKPFGYSPLSISSGEKGTQFIEVFKIDGQAYVPPSSIKGSLRRIFEIVAKAMLKDMRTLEKLMLEAHKETENQGITHYSVETKKIVEDIINQIRNKKRTEIFDIIPEDVLKKDMLDIKVTKELEPLLTPFCPICRMMGGPGLKGKLKILNAEVKGQTSFSTHVSINRASKTYKEGYLYSREKIEIEYLYTEIVIENLLESEKGLVKSVLSHLMKVGMEVGGAKSIGCGALILDSQKSKSFHVNYDTLSQEQLLKAIVNPRVINPISIEQLINEL
ncbi:hypothetical protein B9Q01_09535 [Candidatus Marsarchaeota G1 archaeon OSP_D]|jgi:CRISPR/Cas system CSM-associated protein Csm3 (group 7 of RAMP superfamily)|uniref:CRISPR type III-associated protein domain-containing protein n=3 Tax=Candidatus Marsarchaeota group 1 TaxID=2203770 RepID=A0A2R6A657_9ARCH|nr:MAG: hypothetical protein B9Q01_09535 [Candidatus Marsarchaeota G1 archaeon OSP_D]